jgi:4-diphosphocytidyl-2-C-methyl-D-erythritol kinase
VKKFFKIKSFAKINISLNVIKKLKSKFHKIESLITFVKLYDLIYIRKIESKNHKIFFKGKFSKGIKFNNSIRQLLTIINKKKYIKNKKFEIKIIKNIPQKSGMGGGSMNAASLLNFLIKKKIIKLNKNELIDLCDSIGSDVILGTDFRNTIVSSKNKISRFKNKLNLHVLIVKPNFGCSTKLIYSKVRKFSKSQYNKPSFKLFDLDNIVKSKNDLESIAFKEHPKLKALKLSLMKFPNVIFTRMTGSGSTILAYFKTKSACDIAYKDLKKRYKNYWCIVSKTI